MKTEEQIKVAQEIIKSLQDYIELAKVEKKLKQQENIIFIQKQIEVINETVSENVNEL